MICPSARQKNYRGHDKVQAVAGLCTLQDLPEIPIENQEFRTAPFTARSFLSSAHIIRRDLFRLFHDRGLAQFFVPIKDIKDIKGIKALKKQRTISRKPILTEDRPVISFFRPNLAGMRIATRARLAVIVYIHRLQENFASKVAEPFSYSASFRFRPSDAERSASLLLGYAA